MWPGAGMISFTNRPSPSTGRRAWVKLMNFVSKTRSFALISRNCVSKRGSCIQMLGFADTTSRSVSRRGGPICVCRHFWARWDHNSLRHNVISRGASERSLVFSVGGEVNLSTAMATYWTNMASSGNPNTWKGGRSAPVHVSTPGNMYT